MRCIVEAAGLNSGKEFETYSLEFLSASDVIIPRKAATKIGFDYKSIDLNLGLSWVNEFVIHAEEISRIVMECLQLVEHITGLV